ncbi:unnamed protein product [Angiostrongylus costaricensis]|uniref:TRAF-type domain-containing protein n=1 Tax=Angiostrongylus costaricensis TaxID=334426 RepID=A0A0R3PF17_ANGCS|nr:unnamed protein product [Angiostrongylus costaricensis]
MEELEWLSVRDIVHFTHCVSCHLAKCEVESILQCKCPQCHVSMHECKIEDHITEICHKTFTPCINASYGCRKLIRRDRRSRHLENCSASVVVCGREWDRCVLSPTSKLQLKKWGKGIERDSSNLPLDIALTISDQNVIIQSYGFSRFDRVRRRDGLHPSHPVLPLREVSHFSDEENSSDEETRAKVVFTLHLGVQGFFFPILLFQMDPSSQHLHTLGNESVKYEEIKRVKRFGKDLNFSPETMPEFLVRGENIAHIPLTFFVLLKCLKTFRRVEYADHHVSQHVRCINSLSDLVVRCPNWQRGCTFYTTRLRPKLNFFRFLSSLDSISFLPSFPDYNENTSLPRPLDTLPAWLIITLLKYLPNSAIRSLSQTSRYRVFITKMNFAILSFLIALRMSALLLSHFQYFSVAEKPLEYFWEPAPKLGDHLTHCEYSDVVEYHEVRVPVLSSNLQQITNEFMKRLPYFT